VGDITFIWTRGGWAYLAILVDLCTRAIVGWAVSDRCDSALAQTCLRRAVARHRPPPRLLHHTDRGSTGEFNESSQHVLLESVTDH
jgi:transposase InsO family protein